MTTNSKPNLFNPSLLKAHSVSDQECDVWRKKLDAEYKAMEVGKKIDIKHGSENNHYLPLPSTLFDFLGFKNGIVNYSEQLEVMGCEPLNISRTGQYDLQNKGVGVRTYKKLTDWMLNNFSFLMHFTIEGEDARLDLSYQLNSNAFSWLTMLKTMEVLGSYDDNPPIKPEYIPLLEFIEYRCDTEVASRQESRNRNDMPSNARDAVGRCWKTFIKPLFAEHTVLSLDTLGSMDELMVKGSVPSDLIIVEKNALYENILRLKSDFILTAIAHYEVGCAITFCPNNEDVTSQFGLVGKAIINYSNSDADRTCFDYSLEVLKDRLSEVMPDMSWRKLATYIDINESDKRAELLSHKQYSRLKDWRTGKNSPSNKLLKQFTTNILGNDTDDSLFIHCRIAIGIDQMIANLEDELIRELGNVDEVKQMWKQVLSHYSNDYYLHYLNQHKTRKKQHK